MSVTGPQRARSMLFNDGDLEGAEDAPRPAILASWLRSRQKGVDPGAPPRPASTRPAVDSRLARAALPALDAVTSDLVDSAAALLAIVAAELPRTGCAPPVATRTSPYGPRHRRAGGPTRPRCSPAASPPSAGPGGRR